MVQCISPDFNHLHLTFIIFTIIRFPCSTVFHKIFYSNNNICEMIGLTCSSNSFENSLKGHIQKCSKSTGGKCLTLWEMLE